MCQSFLSFVSVIEGKQVRKLSRAQSPGDVDSQAMNVDANEGEEEEWGGVADEETSHSNHPKSKKISITDGVQAIKDASELYRSSSFKLQASFCSARAHECLQS